MVTNTPISVVQGKQDIIGVGKGGVTFVDDQPFAISDGYDLQRFACFTLGL